MPNPVKNLDQAFAIVQIQITKDGNLTATEPLSVNPVSTTGLPYRAITLSFGSTPFAILGLTGSNYAVQSASFSENVSRRALARKIPFIILSNLRETILVSTPRKPEQAGEVLCHYPLLFNFNGEFPGGLPAPEIINLEILFEKLAKDLVTLHKDGRLFMEIPDADYFVGRLVKAVEVLRPATQNALITEIGLRPDFAKDLADWAIPQGIPVDLNSEAFAEAVVRQAIYRLLGKIIFYQSLRRARPELPELDVANLDTSQVLPRLYACFAKAHEIDYHAVFREAIIDRLPFPASASAELRGLVEDLNTRDFAHLPQDVVGAVFERLIPPEDRHALGQFFTPEALVDLITGFCVRRPEDTVLDPTCGTGTFLIRAYDRLQTALGVRDHSRLLGQLWGVDVAPFPAELATINLFRKQVDNVGNFPRVLNEDFFQIIPRGRYRFPPLKADLPTTTQVDEPIPEFDAIVGNFPYISADRIEQSQKDYLKKVIYRRLADEWFNVYLDGFCFSQKGTQHEFELAREKGLSLEEYQTRAEPDVASNSDFYAYLFWHAAAFLKPGGRMGIVTSNAWLDVGFGYGLQRFFVNHFKVVAILESRCEPWFEQAAVNTVVTILERCENAEERDAHPARFVKIKVPLSQLIPWDMRHDALNRWLGIQKIVQQIESNWKSGEDSRQPYTWENDDVRVRSVRQGVLRCQVETNKKTVKWGLYLRAPQVYFDILHEASDKLVLLREIAPPARGGTTRINEFFYLSEKNIQKWGIDREFCLPPIKSPGETSTILIDPSTVELKVFVCRKTKDELRASGQLGTLNYIEWGEKQVYSTGVQRGLLWPEGPWVKNRRPGWYALPSSETHMGQIFFTAGYGNRHIQPFSKNKLIADKRLYFLSPKKDGTKPELVAAILNSSLVGMFIELTGRVSLGDGALEMIVDDAYDYLLIPNIQLFGEDKSLNITNAFEILLIRPIRSVMEDVKQEDRQALDFAILEAMGVDPKIWLPRIYDGLTTMVRERTELGKKRSQTRKTRTQKAAGKVLDEVLEDLIPDGPRRFPEDFHSAAAQAGKFRELQLPAFPVRYVGHMFGKEELATQTNEIIQVNNQYEVQFVLFAQAAGQTVARLPMQPVECSRTVNDYKNYLRDLRHQLREAYFRRTLDQAQAERLTNEAWRKLTLPVLAD